MAFRPQDLAVVDAFAQQLGTANRPAADGSCSFVFERSGTLTLTPCRDEDRTVVSLARTLPRIDETVMEQALMRAGYDASQRVMLHAGLSGSDLVFAVSLGAGQLTLPALESSLQHLIGVHDAIR